MLLLRHSNPEVTNIQAYLYRVAQPSCSGKCYATRSICATLVFKMLIVFECSVLTQMSLLNLQKNLLMAKSHMSKFVNMSTTSL